MQQRRGEAVERRSGRDVAPKELDYFPTPPWATRALCQFLLSIGMDLGQLTCWEPACGEGHMARPLAEYFGAVKASDVHPYGDHVLADFTLVPLISEEIASVDFVASNPPFRLAIDFIQSATAAARFGFAMLVRSAFLEGAERYGALWSTFPPAYVLQFAERVVMLEGRLVQAGAVDPFAEKPETKASTATSYVWLVWLPGEHDTRLRWLAPCRQQLERAGDYPSYLSAVVQDLGADDLFGTPAAAAAHSAAQPGAGSVGNSNGAGSMVLTGPDFINGLERGEP